ncbi:Uncharacterised protein [uncultured archaeon]|nr:Uncharacterised protein [uncultured archaeon]
MSKLKYYIAFLKSDTKAKILIGLLLILLGLALLN